MKKLRTILIDDESLARDLLRKYLEEIPDVEIVAECADGFQALKSIQELNPDFIFLDIQMPRLTGFELLEVLNDPPAIIFTTAYDQFALKAFEVNAIDYLLKPFSRERFRQAVEKIKISFSDQLKKNKEHVAELKKSVENDRKIIDRVVVRTGNKVKVISTDDILFLEAEDDYIGIFTNEGKHLKQQTLKYFEDHLSETIFLRVHRSYIVNVGQIAQIDLFEKDSYRIVLKNKSIVPVSRNGYSLLRSRLDM